MTKLSSAKTNNAVDIELALAPGKKTFIRFISNKPDPSRFEGDVHAEASTTEDGGDSYNVKGVLNAWTQDLRIISNNDSACGYVFARSTTTPRRPASSSIS